MPKAPGLTLPEGKDGGYPSYPASPTKTPLSNMARLFRKGTQAVVIDDAHHQRCEDLQVQEKSILRNFWLLLIVTAILSSSLSFLIDRFTWAAGLLRHTLTLGAPLKAIGFNVGLACLARIIVRPTMEAEGSGFPEMKAMLFGKVLFNYLTLRVLISKALALSLGVGAGLPLGKEGPNVHLAACIARVIHPSFFEKRVQSSHGAHGAGGSGVGSAVSKLLLAACSVGVGASFSAPIGGVIFALELMLPQTYDAFAYWGCFTAGVVGAITYAVERTLTSGSVRLLPLISSNVLPGEGVDTDYPVMRLAIDIVLGVLCGLAGGTWVRCHSYTAGVLKRWRLREAPLPQVAAAGNQEPLLGEADPARGCCACLWRCFVRLLGGKWRDLFLVAAVVTVNTVLASALPLLGGKPQPLMISTIFDKTLLENDTWVLPWAGVAGTMTLCFLMKWTMTILALSSAIPAGVVAPTMIIGGLLGRVFGHVLLPEWFVSMILTKDGQPPTEDQKGAFFARCAIVGASAFCAAVTRAFAMAITVFEVLALPNSVLPLCSSALAAIFVANKVSLPFFDANLATRNLGGIPAITFTDKAIEPVMKVMHVVDLSECLPQIVTLRHLLHVVSNSDHDFFPIVRPLDWDTSNQGLLEGTMTRRQVELLLKKLDPHAATPDREIDLMNPEFQAPPDGGEPLVEGSPVRVSPDCTVKDVYLLMKVAESDGVVYVTDRGILQGTITLSTLMSREI
ncbi:unnamed protein product [Cladocopium goreaui]|uniref:Chloride channel protein n=1 Tax=Cladocopium goreaui TaxID=2562237 RepID=A0A9P1FQR8_9DINO|nr:unnamed protein product [Cladocopium goreaui]